jgi:hypothetical protein
MNLLGIHLTLMIGPTIAMPAPMPLVDALDSVDVSSGDEGFSGFALNFRVGRSGPLDLLDYPVVGNPLLKAGSRVVLVVTFNAMPSVLMDGVIQTVRLDASAEPGKATYTVMGKDVSVKMDKKHYTAEHKAQADPVIATKVILTYSQYAIVPMVIPPISLDQPIPTERTPVQHETDLAYLKALARRNGYVFYVAPGPAPNTNVGYWGPPMRVDVPQRAITMNMGSASNATNISFSYDYEELTLVEALVQDRLTSTAMPVLVGASTRPPLSAQPAWVAATSEARTETIPTSGLTMMQALARAQARTDASTDVVTAQGQLDTLRYGALLRPRGVVGVRGVGYSNDGLYYVKQVTYKLSRGEFTQNFTLKRDGSGSTTPVVLP